MSVGLHIKVIQLQEQNNHLMVQLMNIVRNLHEEVNNFREYSSEHIIDNKIRREVESCIAERDKELTQSRQLATDQFNALVNKYIELKKKTDELLSESGAF